MEVYKVEIFIIFKVTKGSNPTNEYCSYRVKTSVIGFIKDPVVFARKLASDIFKLGTSALNNLAVDGKAKLTAYGDEFYVQSFEFSFIDLKLIESLWLLNGGDVYVTTNFEIKAISLVNSVNTSKNENYLTNSSCKEVYSILVIKHLINIYKYEMERFEKGFDLKKIDPEPNSNDFYLSVYISFKLNAKDKNLNSFYFSYKVEFTMSGTIKNLFKFADKLGLHILDNGICSLKDFVSEDDCFIIKRSNFFFIADSYLIESVWSLNANHGIGNYDRFDVKITSIVNGVNTLKESLKHYKPIPLMKTVSHIMSTCHYVMNAPSVK